MAVTDRNTTKVKSYVLAIALRMVLVPLVFALGRSGLLRSSSARWWGCGPPFSRRGLP